MFFYIICAVYVAFMVTYMKHKWLHTWSIHGGINGAYMRHICHIYAFIYDPAIPH